VRLGKVELVEVQSVEGNGHLRWREIRQTDVDELSGVECLAGFGLYAPVEGSPP
jgi:hypothetical protein